MVRMGLSCVQGLGVACVPSLCLEMLEGHGAEGTKGGAASAPAPP